MGDLTQDAGRMLSRELEAFAREVERFPDDSSLWSTLPGVTNSAGNLALHLVGNLRHFVGAVLGGDGYERDRPSEFGTRSGSRQDVARALRETAPIVRSALSGLDPARLDEAYPVPLAGGTAPTARFLVHLCVHAGFHLGQAGYLRRILTEDETSVGPIPLDELVD